MYKDSKFNPQDPRHRMQMIQLIHALALEINTGLKTKVNFFAHAKKLGWIPEGMRTKKQALNELVEQAKKGFGYVPKDRIKKAMKPTPIKRKKAA